MTKVLGILVEEAFDDIKMSPVVPLALEMLSPIPETFNVLVTNVSAALEQQYL